MANEVLIKEGGQLLFADHATDFGAAPTTAANSLVRGTPTDVQIDMTGLAAGAARQSAKFDFGTNWGRWHSLKAAIEYATAPAAGEVVDYYIGYSNSATVGTGNPAGLSGSDAAYTGYSSNLEDSLKQLDHIAPMVLTVQATTTVQIDTSIAVFMPKARYGILVVVNRSAADAFVGAGQMDESHIVIDELIDEIQ